MIAPHRVIAPLALALALAGCSATPQQSAPPPPAMSAANQPPPQSSVEHRDAQLRLQNAIAAAQQGRYQDAESGLQSLLASDALGLALRQDTLANLALLYLRVDTPLHNPKAASIALDELYRLSARAPQQRDALLLEALALALENALRLNKLDTQHRAALEQQERLRQNVDALEQALEKLRQLSLQ